MHGTFEEWMGAVDKITERALGVSTDDLIDCDYHSWFEAGMTPEQAFVGALEENTSGEMLDSLLDEDDMDMWEFAEMREAEMKEFSDQMDAEDPNEVW